MNEPQTPALDQASFRRVWQRVMPQDRMDCPFTLEEPQAEAVKASALSPSLFPLPPSRLLCPRGPPPPCPRPPSAWVTPAPGSFPPWNGCWT